MPAAAPAPLPRHPIGRALALLLVECAVLAWPFNQAYHFAMQVVWRAPAATGALFALLVVVLLANAYALWARFVARRGVPELALHRAAGLAAGAALGSALMGVIVVSAMLAGGGYVDAGGAFAGAGLPGVALLAGGAEELIVRGVVLRNLEHVFGSIVALLLTSVLFGALHMANPNATWQSDVAIGIEGGLMLGAVYVATRSLWWTMGLHAAWNFAEGGVFGLADSGAPGNGWWHAVLTGPDWLTGGVFGVEAAWPTALLCAAVAVVFLVIAARRGEILPPPWSATR